VLHYTRFCNCLLITITFYTLLTSLFCITLSDNYDTRPSRWRAHIPERVPKAYQHIGFLRQNLKSSPYKLREMAYLSLMQSSLEYYGSISDPTIKQEINNVEVVQRRDACRAQGAYGINYFTVLLRNLGWLSLTNRQWNQRLCLFYKILHGDLDIKPSDVYLRPVDRITRGSHQWKLQSISVGDKHSLLWKSMILRIIPEWYKLSAPIVQAGLFT
jgi:hypothetical protein